MNRRYKYFLMGLASVILCGCYWFTMNYVSMPGVKYFGIFRYVLDSGIRFYKDDEQVAIEPWIFSYSFEPPYVYTYGVSGFTKTNVALFGKIEKVPNMVYYNNVSEEFTGPFHSTITRLKHQLGYQFVVKKSLEDTDFDDKLIYMKLKDKGREAKEQYFQYYDKNIESKIYLDNL